MGDESFQETGEKLVSQGKFIEALESFYKFKQKQIEQYGPDQSVTAMNRVDIQIASVLYQQGDFKEAFKLYTQTLEKMENYPFDDLFEPKCYVAALYSRKMKKEMAGKIYDELRKHIRNLPDGYPQTIELKKSLALSLKQSGEFQSALEIFKDIHESVKLSHGDAAYVTEYIHAEVAAVLLKLGKYKEALSILEKAHTTFHLDTFVETSYLRLKRHLADAYLCLGSVKVAEDLYRNLMKAMKHKFPNHPEVLATMHSWGRTLAEKNKPNDALYVLKEVHSIRCKQSPKHPDTAKIAMDIATIYLNKNQYIDAIIDFVDVLPHISSTFEWNPDLLLHSVTSVASTFDASDDANLNERLFRAYQHVYQKQFELRGLSDHHKDVLETRTRMGELLIYLKKPAEALEVLKDVLDKRCLVLKNSYIDCVDVVESIAHAYSVLDENTEAFEYYNEVYEIQKLLTGDNSMEAVHWESKILEIAKKKGKTRLIDEIVSKYKISVKTTTDSESNVSMEENFPLHLASETGRIAMIKFLLFKGAIYNEENSEGKMPVNIACCNAVENFFTLIHSLFIAAAKMDHEKIDQILDIMNDSLRQDDAKGFPMLYTGLDQIRDIVDKAILNARDSASGSTLLHFACLNGDVKTVKRLLALEVDCTITNKSNKFPRDVAEDKRFTDILQLLDNYVSSTKNLRDSMISQRDPEMSEDVMEQ